MQVFTNKEKTGALGKTGNTTVQLSASVITIGAKQYTTSNLVCDVSTSGAGGLDTGAMASSTVYYVYIINDNGTAKLITSASVNSIGPTGFSTYKLVGAFYTDASADIDDTTPIKGAPLSKRVAPETITYEGFFSESGNIQKFTNLIIDTSSEYLTSTNDTTTRITFLKKTYFTSSAAARYGTSSFGELLLKDSGNTIRFGSANQDTVGGWTAYSLSGVAEVGDYIELAIHTGNAGSGAHMSVTAMGTNNDILPASNIPLEDL